MPQSPPGSGCSALHSARLTWARTHDAGALGTSETHLTTSGAGRSAAACRLRGSSGPTRPGPMALARGLPHTCRAHTDRLSLPTPSFLSLAALGSGALAISRNAAHERDREKGGCLALQNGNVCGCRGLGSSSVSGTPGALQSDEEAEAQNRAGGHAGRAQGHLADARLRHRLMAEGRACGEGLKTAESLAFPRYGGLLPWRGGGLAEERLAGTPSRLRPHPPRRAVMRES